MERVSSHKELKYGRLSIDGPVDSVVFVEMKANLVDDEFVNSGAPWAGLFFPHRTLTIGPSMPVNDSTILFLFGRYL